MLWGRRSGTAAGPWRRQEVRSSVREAARVRREGGEEQLLEAEGGREGGREEGGGDGSIGIQEV